MTEPLTSDQIFIRKLTDIILANLQNENFGVKELAHESKMSFYRLNRRLHSINKKTTNQFIREIRLNKALEMLRDETSTVAEVAYKVGFGSPAYFNKCFHEYFGYPPGETKKREVISPDQNILTNHTTENESKKPARYILTFTSILFLVLVLGTAGFLIYRKIFRSEWTDNLISSEGRISIAVMPFRNMTNDTTWNIWQENIQQSLISSFSNSKELKVRQRETITPLFQARGITEYSSLTPGIADNISQKLDANIFIYGTIVKAGSSIRLDAQLIKTKTKEVLKSFEINGPCNEAIILDITDTLRKKMIDFFLISKVLKSNPAWDAAYKTHPLTTNSPEALRYNIYGNKAADNQISISWYLKALAIDSNYFDPMMGLSTAYSQIGMMEEDLKWVIKYYNKRKMWPMVQQLWASWAYACSFEPFDERVKYLKQLKQIDDQNANVYYLLGMTYYLNDEYEKAIPELEKFYELDRKLGNEFLKINANYVLLGRAYHKTGQYKKEKKLYKTAEKYITNDPDILSNQIILSLSEKDSIETNKLIEKYISVLKGNSSTEASIAGDLAWIYMKAGIIDISEKYYREAISLDLENPALLNDFACFLRDNNGSPEEFANIIDKAISLAPNKYDYSNYLDTKGWGLYKFGNHHEALNILQKTLDSAQFKLYFIKSHLEAVKKVIGNQD
jgi:AraC-like DNA-binding protein/tetratricopeptide (TPR) repeat protein/TolB-like protein